MSVENKYPVLIGHSLEGRKQLCSIETKQRYRAKGGKSSLLYKIRHK